MSKIFDSDHDRINDGPMFKKTRYMNPWDSDLSPKLECPQHLGLYELFGGRLQKIHYQGSNDVARRIEIGGGNPATFWRNKEYFTLRMEHRVGGPVARYPGEERLLLFRSDRAGAIAKIIFSSNSAKKKSTKQEFSQSQAEFSHLIGGQSYNETDLLQMVQAKIHVLDVKEQYRGFDLGGLLFSKAVEVLKQRSENRFNGSASQNAVPARSLATSIRCQLDAEEDIRRHNKLVDFYERLGCSTKTNAKIQYLNNNDGETYRKIPMQVIIQSDQSNKKELHGKRNSSSSDTSLVGLEGSFLPVRLVQAGIGMPIRIPGNAEQDNCDCRCHEGWLVNDDGKGRIGFQTTHGRRLQAEPGGKCSVVVVSGDVEEAASNSSEEWSSFQLYRISDDNNDSSSSEESDEDQSVGNQFLIIRTCHGTFLTVDPTSQTFSCSKNPSLWKSNDDELCLVCTRDTPPRRQHYQTSWSRQTVEFVTAMRTRYLKFNIKEMGLHEALNLAKTIPGNPFHLNNDGMRTSPSLRSLCFQTAESARQDGHPDWVQLVALLHGLGRVLNCIDTAASSTPDYYDWTLSCRSRVVGCLAPTCASFGEFRNLNKDESDPRYNSPNGMYNANCGLDEVLLMWTGPEYMYHMIKHNSLAIPEDGLAMLRLFSLGDWHTHSEYDHLASIDDEEVRPFVAEFDQMRRRSRRECEEEMSDIECDQLWNEYYVRIATKYNAAGQLR
eukprot:CAMPEP_0195281326 /NCGR_PEP_ID=MMETSP0707-20130614/683_1 /TAXON_ID=33640 /ORGANISM="Asterionellopsis glacialis, Strain CCMP134" /LENGTH=720 /DNA_ID=CAMNT_0040340201 /DNA_START=51 /DNA_END=2210 /DNA_ORIENTATION=-